MDCLQDDDGAAKAFMGRNEDHTMTEKKAVTLAKAFGGESWQSGGEIWLVLRKRQDGKIVAISDELVCEYEDEDAFERSEVWNSILIA